MLYFNKISIVVIKCNPKLFSFEKMIKEYILLTHEIEINTTGTFLNEKENDLT